MTPCCASSESLLVALLALAGAGVWWAKRNLVATPAAPPELARVADPSSLRTLPGGGDVVGYTGRYGSHVWLGIPYALPPVGERRWRAPEPPAAWSGTREALAFGDPLPAVRERVRRASTDVPAGAVSGSEDCLYLNVYAPRMERGAPPAQAKLPGDGLDPRRRQRDRPRRTSTTAGAWRRRHDVVVVTINYRLGPLGWFRHAALREGATPGEQSGNFAHARSGARARVGARQHRRLRRRSGQRHDLRRVGRRPQRVHAAALAARERTLPARDRAERRHRAWIRSRRPSTSATTPSPGIPNSSNEVLARLLVADGKAADRAAAQGAARVARGRRDRGLPARRDAASSSSPRTSATSTKACSTCRSVFADGVVLPDRRSARAASRGRTAGTACR